MSIKLDGNLSFFGKLADQMSKELETAFRDSVGIMQANVRQNIKSKGLIDTGNLVGSVQQNVVFSGRKGLGIVGSNAIYVLPMELGITKKFYPSKLMIEGLVGWVQRKGIATGDEAKKAAAAIAWKIARRGLDPKRFPAKFFEKGFNDSAPIIAKIFQAHMERASSLAGGTSK